MPPMLAGLAADAAGRSSAPAGRPPRSARRFPMRASSRAGATGRPTSSDADLVVNATSERDEVLCALSEGQTLIDLPYPETATGRGRARGGRDA